MPIARNVATERVIAYSIVAEGACAARVVRFLRAAIAGMYSLFGLVGRRAVKAREAFKLKVDKFRRRSIR